jgi:protein TonB
VPHLVRDPLVRKHSRVTAVFGALRLLAAAFGLHVVALVVVVTAGRLAPQPTRFPPAEPLKVRVIDIPPQDLEAAAPALPEPEPAKPAEVEPPKPEPVKPETRPQDAARPPTNEPEKADNAAPPSNAEPLPLIGLSLESTVSGTGPAFATGSSQMGTTRPKQASGSAPRGTSATVSGQAGSAAGTQREATRIPTRDEKIELPRRLRPQQPAYPATLRAQGIEGSVVVSVSIDASGVVQQASVLKGSGHSEFDSAALNKAQSERFAPATRNGAPVPYTLTYSYHFRIED